MSVAVSIRLPDYTARQLEEFSKRTHLSKTDLMVQGLETLFAAELDRKVSYLSDEEFDAVLDFLEKPMPSEAVEKLQKLMNTPYIWEEQDA